MGEVTQATELLQTIGPLGILVLFGVGFVRGVFVLGSTHREIVTMLKDENERARTDGTRWREIALNAVGVTKEAVDHLTTAGSAGTGNGGV